MVSYALGGNQTAALTDSNGNTLGVQPFGALDVSNGPATMFYDTWTGPLDTTNKWTATGTAPTLALGNMSFPTTVSTYFALQTKDRIRPNAGFTYVANGIAIETTTTTGAGRFWGLGTTATTPAAAALVQDGVGFELDQASGNLLAVTYAAGVRTTIATLTRPTDGANHRYALYFRVTGAYWFIDNLTVAVATQTFPNVQVAELPALLVRYNAASYTGTPIFNNIAHLTADTSRQGVSIVDPTIGTRQAKVDAYGSMQQTITSPLGAAAGLAAGITAYNYLRVTTEPGMIFSDPFDGAVVDQTVRWLAPVGTVSQSSGGLSVGNTTVSTVHSAVSRPTFPPLGLNFQVFAWTAQFETTPLVTNVARWMGPGVHSGTPTTTQPVIDGVGFEYPGDGTLRAVVYQNGVRSASSVTINSSALAGPTRYAVLLRADLAIFYVGTTEVPVASISFVTPNQQSLPLRFQQVNGGTVTGSPTMTIGAAAVHDTGHNNQQLSDGTYPFRKAQVGANGALSVKGSALTSATGTVAASATGTVGPLDVSEMGNVTFTVKNAVAGTPYVGNVVVVFEQSDDNVSWAPLNAVRSQDNALGSTFVVTPPAANTSMMFDAAVEGVLWVRARVTTGPTTNSVTVGIAAGSLAFQPSVAAVMSPVVPTTPGTASGNTFVARVAPAAITGSTALVAAPAAGLSIYLTDVSISNPGATLNTVSLLNGATGIYDIGAAALGGGGSMSFRTPIKLTAATALNYTTSAASQTYITVTGYYAP